MAETPEALPLEANLGLDRAAPLREALLARRGAPLTIDASQVERLSALCFQVLASARQTWAADGHTLEIADPSPDFTAGLALMGARAWTTSTQEDFLP